MESRAEIQLKTGSRTNQSVFQLLTTALVLASIIPIAVLGIYLYHAVWQNAWREITEKHQLLAMNLASPISIYVNDHRNTLGLLANTIRNTDASSDASIQSLLNEYIDYVSGFSSLSFVGMNGVAQEIVTTPGVQDPGFSRTVFADEKCFLKTKATGTWQLSGVKRSPLDGRPAIVMSYPVFNRERRQVGVLLGELDVGLIESLRANIRFGTGGHSAIVDANGRVIAHPNAGWMEEMRDISDIDIVRKMMAGKTGVTEFYSPFVKKDMVAGYTSIPGIGWGIMVPQPKEEIEHQVRSLLVSYSLWAFIGLSISIAIAVIFSRWITRPINQLASAANDISQHGYEGELPSVSKRAPREVRLLGQSIKYLFDGLQSSNSKVREFNRNLQKQVEYATLELRESNSRLAELAKKDHLTRLSNRRHFEDMMSELMERQNSGETISVILIDVDNFKHINDLYGHEAGDLALKEIADILRASTRVGDIAARYGGDEFVARFVCDEEIAIRRAEALRKTIEEHVIPWKGKQLRTTVSIGVLLWRANRGQSLKSLMHAADSAMYKAKQSGRNSVYALQSNTDLSKV